MSYSARSYLLLHAVPAAVARQVDWTVSRTIGIEPRLQWQRQPVVSDHVSACFEWFELPAVVANVASALAGWGAIWFEVLHEATIDTDASLWLHTPTLGLKHRSADSAGNIMVSEFELQQALAESRGDQADLARRIDSLLARDWTDELERFRFPESKARLLGLTG